MLSPTSTKPIPVLLDVPKSFQDYLIRMRNLRYLYVLLMVIGCSIYYLALDKKMFIGSIFIFPLLSLASFPSWAKERKMPWKYAIDSSKVDIIWWQGKGFCWSWHTVSWQNVPIIAVEETKWRGLPALRLVRQMRYRKFEPDWLIVYSPEDSERVKTEILPLIEQYRRQYRHELWADRLRS